MPNQQDRDAKIQSPRSSGERQASTEVRLINEIGDKQDRKLKARAEKNQSIWFGLGMFGMVGWSIAVPTLIGIAIGCWLDTKFEGHISWCLTFLFVGIVIGISLAWNWMKKEGRLE